jgi:prevent-host-death family protein
MRIASVADVKAKLSAFLKESASGPIVVTRNGKPVAVLLGVRDEEEIEGLLLSYSPRLRAILDKSRAQIKDGNRLSHDEFWAHTESHDAPRSKRAEPRKKGRDV